MSFPPEVERSERETDHCNSLTPWIRILLEKLVKKFPVFYGVGGFIALLTRAHHCPYPQSDIANPQLPTLFPKHPF